MTQSKLVYIASPYAGDVERNTSFAIHACRFCIAQGHTPIAPHLLYTRMLDDNNPDQRELGLELGRRFLERVDELWACGDRVSPGMAAEIAEAVNLGIPVKRIETLKIFVGSEMLKDMKTAISPSGGMEMVMR
jgi:hypothetical protein